MIPSGHDAPPVTRILDGPSRREEWPHFGSAVGRIGETVWELVMFDGIEGENIAFGLDIIRAFADGIGTEPEELVSV